MFTCSQGGAKQWQKQSNALVKDVFTFMYAAKTHAQCRVQGAKQRENKKEKAQEQGGAQNEQ